MGRIIKFPRGMPIHRVEFLSGPRALKSGASESGSGWVQTSSGIFGLWRLRFSIKSIRDLAFRDYRGFVTAMHGGANATILNVIDYDKMSYADMGADVTVETERDGIRWDGNIFWLHRKTWRIGTPYLENPAPAAKGDSLVTLPPEFWGHQLEVGDIFGYGPDHLGMYVVTESFGSGEYRIWPPLRKDVTALDLVIMDPPLAMRLESEEAANIGRALGGSDELVLTMVEIEDSDVRNFYL